MKKNAEGQQQTKTIRKTQKRRKYGDIRRHRHPANPLKWVSNYRHHGEDPKILTEYVIGYCGCKIDPRTIKMPKES